MKKFISLLLILLLNFIAIEPAMAELNNYQEENSSVLSATVEDEKVFLNPKSTYILELESDIDINETKPNDEIFFSLVSKVQASNGMVLPEHSSLRTPIIPPNTY